MASADDEQAMVLERLGLDKELREATRNDSV
jgi:hypothetical protein